MAKTKRLDQSHSVKQAPAPDPVRDAVGITALAKSQKVDAQRNLLQPGLHTVALTVYGEIDGQKWQRGIHGSLVIAPDSAPVASSSTPWAELLHSALSAMTASYRQAWLATVADGAVPEPACGAEKSAAIEAEMEPAIKAYRATKPTPKRGNVSFVPKAGR